MKAEELKQIIDLHKIWLGNHDSGKYAYLRDANLTGADLTGAYLTGAYLTDANLRGAKIATLHVYSGLYRYEVWAFTTEQGAACVRMGCFYKSVADWDTIGIRKSNPKEFRDDGSEASEGRARAFEFARTQALLDAKQVCQKENKKQ